MDNEEVKNLNETMKRFEKLLQIARMELHWQPFRFNTGSVQHCYVQKNRHCQVDGIHNPNPTSTQVTLKEEGVIIYQNTLAPYSSDPRLELPFMRECVLTTDGNAITIWGKIRA